MTLPRIIKKGHYYSVRNQDRQKELIKILKKYGIDWCDCKKIEKIIVELAKRKEKATILIKDNNQDMGYCILTIVLLPLVKSELEKYMEIGKVIDNILGVTLILLFFVVIYSCACSVIRSFVDTINESENKIYDLLIDDLNEIMICGYQDCDNETIYYTVSVVKQRQ